MHSMQAVPGYIAPHGNPSIRRCMFTLNNPLPGDEAILSRYVSTDTHPISYIIYGREHFAGGGTPHLQGYCEFRCTRFSTVRGWFWSRAHLTSPVVAKAAAIAYCKKDGDFYESGTCHNQGRRHDFHAAQDLLDSGAPAFAIADTQMALWCVHNRSFEKYAQKIIPMRDSSRAPTVRFLHGVTGTGKSRYVHSLFPDCFVYPGERWFDGYNNHGVVLFDDLTDQDFPIHHLLKLLDRYKGQVRVKHAHVQWNPHTIFITSNIPLALWYLQEPQVHRNALFRRVSSIQQFV